MSSLVFSRDVPDWIEGEPDLHAPTAFSLVKFFFKTCILLTLSSICLGWLWVPFLFLCLVYGWPPFKKPWHVWDHFTSILTSPVPPISHKIVLLIELALRVSLIPFWGCSWFLDELLYGSKMNAVEINEPLFEISAARSGSTQLGRYLEQDPTLVTVPMARFFLPFLWMWKLAPYTIGLFISKEEMQEKMLASMPPAFVERHEVDIFGTDTFEVGFLMQNLMDATFFLGVDFAQQQFGPMFLTKGSNIEKMWTVDFSDFLERVGRKELVYQNASSKRLFIKGHFLQARDELASRFPDAHFLTMIRQPDRVIQSACNFSHTHPHSALGVPKFQIQAEAVAANMVEYFEVEYEWYTKDDGVKKTVLRFSDYVKDLEGAMKFIYSSCMNGREVPAQIPREHAKRKRTGYCINRSLKDLGISEEEIRVRLKHYYEWI